MVDEGFEKFISNYIFYSDEILPNEEESFMFLLNNYNQKLKEHWLTEQVLIKSEILDFEKIYNKVKDMD